MHFLKVRHIKTVAFLVYLVVFLTLLYSMFSGPVAEKFNLKESLLKASTLSKESRAVVIYHTLAVPFVSLVAVLILFTFNFEEKDKDMITTTLLWGSYLSSVSGLLFSYFNGGMIAHGLFITGLSLVFYGGVLFFLKSLNLPGVFYSSKLEKISFVVLLISFLLSVIIGAAVGAFYGTKFETVLAEDIIRESHDVFERAVISHLHIVVALVCASVLFLLVRYFGLARYEKLFYLLFLAGITITSLSTWAVIIETLEKKAHRIINIGAMLLILSSLVYAYNAITRLKFGGRSYLEMLSVFHLFAVNATVTAPGIYVAFNLSKFRLPEYFEIERTFATGHWHILAATCALILSVVLSHISGFDNSKFVVLMLWISHLLITASFVLANFYFFTLNKSLMVPLKILLGAGFAALVFTVVFAAHCLLKKARS